MCAAQVGDAYVNLCGSSFFFIKINCQVQSFTDRLWLRTSIWYLQYMITSSTADNILIGRVCKTLTDDVQCINNVLLTVIGVSQSTWWRWGKHCIMVVEVWITFHTNLFGPQSETKEPWNWGMDEYDQNKDRFPLGVVIYMMTHSCVYMVYHSKPCWDWTTAVLSYEICSPVFSLLSIINTRSWNEKVISLERTRYNWHKSLP